MATFGGDYFSKYSSDLISSATSKARAAARNEVNKEESASFDTQGLSASVGDTFKDPITGEYTKEVTITQKKDNAPVPSKDKILGMNKFVVIGGVAALVLIGGFFIYEISKNK